MAAGDFTENKNFKSDGNYIWVQIVIPCIDQLGASDLAEKFYYNL